MESIAVDGLTGTVRRHDRRGPDRIRIFHAPLLRSVDGLHLQKIVEHRGDVEVEALLNDREIELVVIATPNESHFDLGRRALLADKHVVIDKPFTVTSDQAQQLIDLARERNRILTVFHNRRWEGDFLTIRRLIDQNAFGRVVFFEARFDRFRNEPRPGAWPQPVVADVRRERDFGDADDAFDIWMKYPRLKVSLAAGMLIRERTPRFTIRGTTATFTKSGLDPQEAALAEGRTPRDGNWGRERREQWGTLITDRGEEIIETQPGSYQSFYENVRDVIAGRAQLAVDPEQAQTTIEIIEQLWSGFPESFRIRAEKPRA